MAMDVIDYEIFGESLQYVEVELDPGEAAMGEAGAMMMMQDGIVMDTIFGDGSNKNKSEGILGSLVGAGKRLVTGEGLFTTVFKNEGSGKKRIAFAAPYPGQIIPVDLAKWGGEFICQKDAFLCAAKGVQLSLAFQRKIMTGFFGGEGFIMQRLIGDGLAFVHAGGTLKEIDLQSGELIRLDTGCIVGYAPSVTMDVEYVGSVKSAFFSGEGLAFATLTGPGKVFVQSLPLDRMAMAFIPRIKVSD